MIEAIIGMLFGAFNAIPTEDKIKAAKSIAEFALDHVPLDELKEHLTQSSIRRAQVAAMAAEVAKFGQT